jgi:hypothetical protein
MHRYRTDPRAVVRPRDRDTASSRSYCQSFMYHVINNFEFWSLYENESEIFYITIQTVYYGPNERNRDCSACSWSLVCWNYRSATTQSNHIVGTFVHSSGTHFHFRIHQFSLYDCNWHRYSFGMGVICTDGGRISESHTDPWVSCPRIVLHWVLSLNGDLITNTELARLLYHRLQTEESQ